MWGLTNYKLYIYVCVCVCVCVCIYTLFKFPCIISFYVMQTHALFCELEWSGMVNHFSYEF